MSRRFCGANFSGVLNILQFQITRAVFAEVRMRDYPGMGDENSNESVTLITYAERDGFSKSNLLLTKVTFWMNFSKARNTKLL